MILKTYDISSTLHRTVDKKPKSKYQSFELFKDFQNEVKVIFVDFIVQRFWEEAIKRTHG